MKVLQILSQMELTGAEAYAVSLSEWLLTEGHDVHLVSNKIHLPFRGHFHAREIHTSSTLTRFKNIFFLRRLIKQEQIQVIHCHSRAAVRVGFWARLGLPVTLISTVHGRQHFSLSKKIFDLYGDRVVAVCENLQRSLVRDFKMNPRKIRVLGNPVGLPTPSQISKGLAQDKIAYIGRFSGPKGERLRDLLEKTFPVLLARFPRLHIDLIGGDLGQTKGLAQAFEQVHDLFPGRLSSVGKIQNLRDHYPRYDLIIGSGRVAVEALQRQVTCYSLGEYKSESVLNLASYEDAKKSNFGDIGAQDVSTPVDYAKTAQEISETLQNPLSSNEKEALRKRVEEDFSQTEICRTLFDLYQSSYFRRLKPKTIPVLMYHKIPLQDQNSRHRIFVTRDNFEKHLQFFSRNGFTTMSFSELDEFRTLRRPLSEFPPKPLILTFDDGYVDNLENAGPLLKKYNHKATIFLLADSSLLTNSWDADTGEAPDVLMNLEQKRRLSDYNFEIGSHGFHHQKITEMTDEQALHELIDSKRVLERDLGVQIPVFAYTYGVTSPRAAQLAQRAYRFAVNTDTGGLHLEENPYAIFRTNVFPEDSDAQLRKKTATWYRRYFYFKRKK